MWSDLSWSWITWAHYPRCQIHGQDIIFCWYKIEEVFHEGSRQTGSPVQSTIWNARTGAGLGLRRPAPRCILHDLAFCDALCWSMFQSSFLPLFCSYLMFSLCSFVNMFLLCLMFFFHPCASLLRFGLDRGVRLKPQIPIPMFRGHLAKKGTHL